MITTAKILSEGNQGYQVKLLETSILRKQFSDYCRSLGRVVDDRVAYAEFFGKRFGHSADNDSVRRLTIGDFGKPETAKIVLEDTPQTSFEVQIDQNYLLCFLDNEQVKTDFNLYKSRNAKLSDLLARFGRTNFDEPLNRDTVRKLIADKDVEGDEESWFSYDTANIILKKYPKLPFVVRSPRRGRVKAFDEMMQRGARCAVVSGGWCEQIVYNSLERFLARKGIKVVGKYFISNHQVREKFDELSLHFVIGACGFDVNSKYNITSNLYDLNFQLLHPLKFAGGRRRPSWNGLRIGVLLNSPEYYFIKQFLSESEMGRVLAVAYNDPYSESKLFFKDFRAGRFDAIIMSGYRLFSETYKVGFAWPSERRGCVASDSNIALQRLLDYGDFTREVALSDFDADIRWRQVNRVVSARIGLDSISIVSVSDDDRFRKTFSDFVSSEILTCWDRSGLLVQERRERFLLGSGGYDISSIGIDGSLV